MAGASLPAALWLPWGEQGLGALRTPPVPNWAGTAGAQGMALAPVPVCSSPGLG